MVSRKVFQSGFRPLLGLFFGYPQLWEMKKEREKVEKERERDRERKRERERERWKMETNRRRERERQREEEGEERESVVNGEQRGESGFSLFLSVGTFQEKTGKERREGRKRQRERRSLETVSRKMSTIRIRFGCSLFRTAAGLSGPNVYIRVRFGCSKCLSGPRNLELEYFLGACFSGPLQVFPDHNGYN